MTKHTVSAAATGLPEFTRRKALLPITGLISVGAVATAVAAVPATTPFMVAADAYREICVAIPSRWTDENGKKWEEQLDVLHDRLVACPLLNNRDAAELVQFVQDEELTDKGDILALEKLKAFLLAQGRAS